MKFPIGKILIERLLLEYHTEGPILVQSQSEIDESNRELATRARPRILEWNLGIFKG